MIPVPPALVALRQTVNASYMWRNNGGPVTIPEGANIPTGVKWAPDPALADQLIDAEREHLERYRPEGRQQIGWRAPVRADGVIDGNWWHYRLDEEHPSVAEAWYDDDPTDPPQSDDAA